MMRDLICGCNQELEEKGGKHCGNLNYKERWFAEKRQRQ